MVEGVFGRAGATPAREELAVEIFGKYENSVVVTSSGPKVSIDGDDAAQTKVFLGLEFPDGEKLIIKTKAGPMDKMIKAVIDVLDNRLKKVT